MRIYKPMAGECIEETAKRIVALADAAADEIQADFNEITLTAQPGDKADDIVTYYQTESNRRHIEYIDSPEYKEQCRKAQERKEKRKAEQAAALATAPAQMSFKDKALWDEGVAKNQDPYGAACYTFAERWARLMEGQFLAGEALESCADKMCSLADDEGITGFMYGCAVSILAHVWIHGEALRRWHNLETQVRDEGERANKEGGVLNPAILTIG